MNLKLYIALFLFQSCLLFPQAEEKLISDINQKKIEIDQWLKKESTYPAIEIYEQCFYENDEQEDPSTGTISYYYDNDDLIYIYHEYKPGVDIYEYIDTKYYIENNRIIYIFQDKSEGGNPFKTNKTRVELSHLKIFYDNELPVKCLQKKYTILDWPEEDPYEKIKNVPYTEIECMEDQLFIEIRDLPYYLNLLELSDEELKANCFGLSRN